MGVDIETIFDLAEVSKEPDAKQKMKIVDDLTNDISEKLGRLTGKGVLSVNDSFKIMMIMNDSQYEWMEKNFTEDEIIALILEK